MQPERSPLPVTPEMGHRARILIVDDELRNRALMRRFLGSQWEVLEAASGGEALELVRSGQVDVVLLDVVMPGLDGLATCRLIKSDLRAHFLPVILVTGRGEQEDRNRGLEAGADDFLQKPVDPQELLLRVRNFVRLRDQERLIRAQVDDLRRLSAFKDDTVSLLVHDLRNPLSGVISCLELAIEQATERELREDLLRALGSAESLRGSLDETLQVRLLEENALTARRTGVDLCGIVRAALATLQPVARRRSIELRWDIAGDPFASVDARLLQRALENLLSNALKYSAKGTEVELHASNNGGAVEIEVADRGPGIPDALKGVLFERFGSLEAHRGQQRRGIGLGLYLVKLVAKAHGGEVAVRDRPGGGAVFRLRLAPPPAATTPAGEQG